MRGGGLIGLMIDGSRSAGQFQLYSSFGGDSVLAVESLMRAFFLGRSLSGKSAMELVLMRRLVWWFASEIRFKVVEAGDPVSFMAAWLDHVQLALSFSHVNKLKPTTSTLVNL